MITDTIKEQIQQVIKRLKLPEVDINLEHPGEESHGDYSCNIAMVLAAKAEKNPRELATAIVTELEKDKELKKVVDKIEVAGSGFINFWLANDCLINELELINTDKQIIPSFLLGPAKKIIVEFAHPNTHKLLHIGHLRNISLAESIIRILETIGNKVIRANYQGDVGMHIAKCIYGMMQTGEKTPKTLDEKIKYLGKSYQEGNSYYENNEEAKQKIHVINKKIYNRDPKILKLWKKTRQWSLDYYDEFYKRVYSHFDRLYFESEVYDSGLKMSKQALKDGILEKSKGAVVFNGDKYGLHTRVFITSEGNPTYEGKELGLAELEFSEHGEIDKCIHIVGPEQASFFQVTFKAEELINSVKYQNKQLHYIYGFVQLAKGKMSSRKGTVITAQWLLDEVKNKITKSFDVDDKSAEIIMIGAVKYSMLKVDPKSEIAFDINQSISLEGNSGPYLQYTYARCKSIARKSENSKSDTSLQPNIEELTILRTLYKYPEVVLEAGKTYSPNLICNYLFDLAQKYNTFYNKHKVIGGDNVQFRLQLTSATAQVLKNGLKLLGIKTLEKM
ncbi:arginine--tRNA ligase [Candidatus Roizmanbacteria bacterium CG22_combo_CG10-13_8_21_14_all_38_20]|uniref:Arginine--tRNA ligase n=1 Tax=Candidatus Roizmanbacteria bacterium CG22_combo_CG10-13_8_21_14_all_38_20 TaxID=1974862 RepID=A0A2H0BWY2_9BACT|nr:arginine--tRNA ligase [Candidatus Microgenomates bacterium]PIP62104.1 MAG: arginine--tRNA ligase [Candidatus Roizmanbacteria bacterium CG22_combo_CG10-13_8_21_14_all_38_20]PJC31830.1 MAG: arginine--tRNA ligase [Candidatus Roizmanbacteria bacterium CG_4_9_14_0_2_um_filter_38_17]